MLISVQLIELNPLIICIREDYKTSNKARQQKVLNGNANKVKYILLSSYASSIQDNRFAKRENDVFSAWPCHVALQHGPDRNTWLNDRVSLNLNQIPQRANAKGKSKPAGPVCVALSHILPKVNGYGLTSRSNLYFYR
jgi:hypothetical protein